MSYDLSKPLVIGISSRALFNLEQENKIFEEQGVEWPQFTGGERYFNNIGARVA